MFAKLHKTQEICKFIKAKMKTIEECTAAMEEKLEQVNEENIIVGSFAFYLFLQTLILKLFTRKVKVHKKRL